MRQLVYDHAGEGKQGDQEAWDQKHKIVRLVSKGFFSGNDVFGDVDIVRIGGIGSGLRQQGVAALAVVVEMVRQGQGGGGIAVAFILAVALAGQLQGLPVFLFLEQHPCLRRQGIEVLVVLGQ